MNPSPINNQESSLQSSNKPNTNNQTNVSSFRTPKPCFKCGERFFPGHQCKIQQTLMTIQIGEKEKTGEENEEVWHDVEGEKLLTCKKRQPYQDMLSKRSKELK